MSLTTKSSALALLADGNGVESVAHVLGRSVDEVLAWQREAASGAAATAQDAPPAGSEVFRSELVYRADRAARARAWGFAVFAAALSLFGHQAMVAAPPADGSNWAAHVLCLCGLVVAAAAAWTTRTRVVFGLRAITDHRFSRTQSMAYSDIARGTLVRETLRFRKGPDIAGNRLVLQARRADVPPLSLFFPDARPPDAAIIARLARLPGLAGASLAALAGTQRQTQTRTRT